MANLLRLCKVSLSFKQSGVEWLDYGMFMLLHNKIVCNSVASCCLQKQTVQQLVFHLIITCIIMYEDVYL